MSKTQYESDLDFAWKISLIIRLLLGGFLLWLVWHFKEHSALYLAGAALIISAFFKPRRCAADSCNNENA